MEKVRNIKPARSELYDTAAAVVRRLRDEGHRAYFVGGGPRDMVMDMPPEEYDITTSATPEQVSAIFPHTVPVGVSFGVILVLEGDFKFEVATFRKDLSYSDGRHPDSVEYSEHERDDVLRRDFTINGMLYDPLREVIIDYVGGIEDLDRGLLRTIGEARERFSEDKLRMMRAVRFGARYGFEIERNTLEAVKAQSANITQVSAERIRDELVKIISQQNPGAGLTLLMKSGLLEYILPEAAVMKGVEQPPEFHPEGDVFTHTCMVLDRLYANEDGNVPVELAMAGLLHDIGKPPTFSVSDRIRFNGHDRIGADMSRDIMKRLKFSNRQIDVVYSLVREHLKFKDVFNMRQSTLKRFIGMPDFDYHLALHLADCQASHGITDAYSYVKKALSEMEDDEIKPKPLLDGKALIAMGYEPGPIFSEILNYVEEAQLEGEIKDREEAEKIVKDKYPLS